MHIEAQYSVRLIIDDEDTLLYLRDLTQNYLGQGAEPQSLREQRQRVYTQVSKALERLSCDPRNYVTDEEA